MLVWSIHLNTGGNIEGGVHRERIASIQRMQGKERASVWSWIGMMRLDFIALEACSRASMLHSELDLLEIEEDLAMYVLYHS